MRNEKGMTLIELLVAIVILTMVLVPVLTIMTGTTVRTEENKRTSSNLFLAQEVMEKIRMNEGDYKVDRNIGTFCASEVIELCEGHHPLHTNFKLNLEEQQRVLVTVDKMTDHFNEVKVVVSNVRKDDKGNIHHENKVELVTVVK